MLSFEHIINVKSIKNILQSFPPNINISKSGMYFALTTYLNSGTKFSSEIFDLIWTF